MIDYRDGTWRPAKVAAILCFVFGFLASLFSGTGYEGAWLRCDIGPYGLLYFTVGGTGVLMWNAVTESALRLGEQDRSAFEMVGQFIFGGLVALLIATPTTVFGWVISDSALWWWDGALHPNWICNNRPVGHDFLPGDSIGQTYD